jgi:hypothetical protein
VGGKLFDAYGTTEVRREVGRVNTAWDAACGGCSLIMQRLRERLGRVTVEGVASCPDNQVDFCGARILFIPCMN